MKGFKEFLLRGNLIEIAVAFIMATAFAAVVTAFTGLVMAIISKVFGGPPTVGAMNIAGVSFGPFLNALIAFVILAAVVYFGIVMPYQKFRDRKKVEEPEAAATPEELLTEIRDLLASR